MSNTKMHTTLIKRTGIGTLYDYFNMKNIKEYQFLRNNHGELKPYEKQFGRELTRMDAIVISPLTPSEITDIINGYYENEELLGYQRQKNKERIKIYEESFGERP